VNSKVNELETMELILIKFHVRLIKSFLLECRVTHVTDFILVVQKPCCPINGGRRHRAVNIIT
jgi:hypothetical protein